MFFTFDSGGPSQLRVYIPGVNSQAIPLTWQPNDDNGSIDKLVDQYTSNNQTALINGYQFIT